METSLVGGRVTESARNLPVETPPSDLKAALELRLTEQNLRDLLGGKSIQVAQIGGVFLKMTLHPAIDQTTITNIIDEAKKTMPTLTRPASSS